MKKLIALLLSAVLVLGLCACGGASGSEDITGRYDMVSITQDGVTIDVAEYLASLDIEAEAYLELKANGFAVLCFGDTLDLVYEDGMIWPEGEPEGKVPFTIDGKTLTMEQNGEKMVFKKN